MQPVFVLSIKEAKKRDAINQKKTLKQQLKIMNNKNALVENKLMLKQKEQYDKVTAAVVAVEEKA